MRYSTTVRYDAGEGTAPYGDAKGATLLVCLLAPEPGGRTVSARGIAARRVQEAAVGM